MWVLNLPWKPTINYLDAASMKKHQWIRMRVRWIAAKMASVQKKVMMVKIVAKMVNAQWKVMTVKIAARKLIAKCPPGRPGRTGTVAKMASAQWKDMMAKIAVRKRMHTNINY